MIAVPKLEEVSPEYKRLTNRHAELVARGAEIDAEVRTLYAAMGSEQATDRHTDRVAALISGVDYSPPVLIKDQLAQLAAERRAIDAAVKELHGPIALERQRASRAIVAGFEAERRALAAEFFEHVAAAAKAHAAYGEMRRAFYRAEVDPAGFSDFGIDLFGDPGHRNGPTGIAMRVAARKGYLTEARIPEAYR